MGPGGARAADERAVRAVSRPGGAYLDGFAFLSAVWPWKVRVGANSPSLWPTMFSVTNTGKNFFPLCTANVWPTKSGGMVERRDQVLMTLRWLLRLRSSTFLRR